MIQGIAVFDTMVVADFNGDGYDDIAAIDIASGANRLMVLLGNGDGTFQAPVITTGIASIRSLGSLVVADFDGDGKADVAFANSNQIVVLRGKGDGTFQAPVAFPVDTGAVSIAVSDFNGDGIPDLAVANSGANDVSILLGNGDGTFQTAINLGVAASPTSIIAGDFNGDGQNDLAVTSALGVALLHGHGDGSFDKPVYVGPAANVVAVGEFNGDGMADLAVGTATGVSVLLGQANAALSVSPAGPVNAASLKIGPVVPGSEATIFGSFPVPAPVAASGYPLPAQLGGVSVQLSNGLSVPLLAVSPGQVTFQVPWELLGQPQPTITVTFGGQTSPPQTLQLAPSSPGIFSTNGLGTGQGMIYDASGRLVDASNPATAGSTVVRILCTGLGPVTNQPPTGAVTPAPRLRPRSSDKRCTLARQRTAGRSQYSPPRSYPGQ